ncbi:MAG: DUF4258 domain-containing protein [Ardenticatenales bacterium]|nr:DUF4258 domain-containing protein [Ardenticatenales bacterium]
MNDLPIEISHHAQQQMLERGVEQAEVTAAIREGQAEPARKNRALFRKNFQFDGVWCGRPYRIKQVAPVVATEADRLVVVTVYAFYF